MFEDLKEKDIKVLEFLVEHTGQKGYPPSVREICSTLDIKSTSTVFAILNRLEKLEYIKRDPTKPRAIEILNRNSDTTITNSEIVNIPVVGNIAAGSPIFADENIEEYMPLPASYIKGKSCFMLHVKGDSMINAGIFENDLIIVDSSNKSPNKGKIVAALINGETATVKRYYVENKHVVLKSENPEYQDMIFMPEEVDILGCVTGVFRML